MTTELPTLAKINQDNFSRLGDLPRLVIKTEEDVETWQNCRAYHDYDLFLRRLNEAVTGVYLPWEPSNVKESIAKTVELLDTLDSWISEIPPLETPQRFGNIAFRAWGARLEERVAEILGRLLPAGHKILIPYIKPYLIAAFGSFTRMDYGTGHEASFGLFLLCLTLVGFFESTQDEERQIVLIVFLRYLRLCWRLQDVYKLEPAGSHGVWGLDDYCFLPYIFGSGQLRDQTAIAPSVILHPQLPPTNLYFMTIMRIHEVKRGPFHEHSSQLHSIATGVFNWGKVNSGLFKMYRAEVLGKRVVVQHIPLGGLLEWERSGSQPTASVVTPPTVTSSSAHSTTATTSELVGSTRYTGHTPSEHYSSTKAPW